MFYTWLILLIHLYCNENVTPLQLSAFLKNVSSSFPNKEIGIRIMLTILVTPTGAGRIFSKLKMIKNGLRSTLSQHKLCDLALISIEHNIVESFSYDEKIDLFVNKKARKK